jgi:hypothetical protein
LIKRFKEAKKTMARIGHDRIKQFRQQVRSEDVGIYTILEAKLAAEVALVVGEVGVLGEANAKLLSEYNRAEKVKKVAKKKLEKRKA